jgi:exosortase A-associated hydrolase 2
MNLARRILRRQAAALAAVGIAALLLDPFGTGDSAGDFAEARWKIWLADVRVGAAALAARGVRQIGLFGIRFGALLAAAGAPGLASPCFATVLWQPVLHGRSQLDELLRLGMLGAVSHGRRPMTVETARSSLAAGNPVEVAGYEIAPALARALTALDLAGFPDKALGRIAWFDIGRDPAPPVLALRAECIALWMAHGLPVERRSFPGPAFWALPGSAAAPALIAATTAAFAAEP